MRVEGREAAFAVVCAALVMAAAIAGAWAVRSEGTLTADAPPLGVQPTAAALKGDPAPSPEKTRMDFIYRIDRCSSGPGWLYLEVRSVNQDGYYYSYTDYAPNAYLDNGENNLSYEMDFLDWNDSYYYYYDDDYRTAGIFITGLEAGHYNVTAALHDTYYETWPNPCVGVDVPAEASSDIEITKITYSETEDDYYYYNSFSVALQWKAPSGGGDHSYAIYRGTDAGTMRLIGYSNDTSWVDVNPPIRYDSDYYYEDSSDWPFSSGNDEPQLVPVDIFYRVSVVDDWSSGSPDASDNHLSEAKMIHVESPEPPGPPYLTCALGAGAFLLLLAAIAGGTAYLIVKVAKVEPPAKGDAQAGRPANAGPQEGQPVKAEPQAGQPANAEPQPGPPK